MRYALSLLFMTLCLPLSAVQEYYTLSRSVRAMGMGGAFYALSDDEHALFYNPAALNFYHGRPRVTLFNVGLMASGAAVSDLSNVINVASARGDVQNLAGQIADQMNSPISAGGGFFSGYLQKNFALGLVVGDTKLNAALYGVGPNALLDVTAITDSGLFLAWARRFRKHWHLGLTTKAVYRAAGRNTYDSVDFATGKQFSFSTFQQGGTAFALDADAGAIYEITDPWIGSEAGLSFVLSNALGTNLVSSGNDPPTLPRMFAAGLYTVFEGHKLAESYTLRIDASDFPLAGYQNQDLGGRGGNLLKHLDAGLEAKISPTLMLRGGVHQGDWTAGLGFYLPGIHLDFATYGEELLGYPGALSSRRFALQLSLGFEMVGSHAVFLEPN